MAYSNYYVDPGAGNDTTGDGAIGTPWKTVQHALDTITRNATDGDRINVKAGTADTLGAALSLATYGTPGLVTPLTIQGYTSVAGDGGIGEINGAGSYGIISTTAVVMFADMKLGNCGSTAVLVIGNYSQVHNCEIHTSSGFAIDPGTHVQIIGNWFHDITAATTVDANSSTAICFNNFNVAAKTTVVALGSSYMSAFVGNTIYVAGADTSVIGVHIVSYGTLVIFNTIISSNANTGRGIYAQYGNGFIANNIIQGWSGAGGDGLEMAAPTGSTLAANAYYNNTAPETDNTTAKWHYVAKAATALGATPFIDAANGDFDINGTIVGVTEAAYPTAYRGLASTSPKADVGAVQAGAGSSGGVNMPRVRVGH